MTTDSTLTTAIRDVILPLQRLDDSHIIRQTTVAAAHPVAPAATSVTLTDATGFAISGLLRYDDTTGEPSASIVGIAGSVASLTKPASFAHAAGTTVYTNLFAIAPWEIAAMLNGQDPVIFIQVTRYATRMFAMPGATDSTYQAHIQYHRLLNRPDPTVNPNDWVDHLETESRADLALINQTLLKNQKLATNHAVEQAVQMGRLNERGDLTIVDWGRNEVEVDTWHWIGTIDAIYAGNPS